MGPVNFVNNFVSPQIELHFGDLAPNRSEADLKRKYLVNSHLHAHHRRQSSRGVAALQKAGSRPQLPDSRVNCGRFFRNFPA
jgi:hypothetical protein